MGRVILVAPPNHLEIPSFRQHFNTGDRFNVIPLDLNVTAGNGNFTVHGSVRVPNPEISYEPYEPMIAMGHYYELGHRYRSGRVAAKSSSPHPQALMFTMTQEHVDETFWDRLEIEECVESWHGDLMISIDEKQQKWTFMVTDNRDSQTFQQLMDRRRKHEFSTPKALRSEVIAWLNENASDFELLERSYLPTDRVFVRDDNEAVHFKLRWFGAEAEEDDAIA